MRLAGFDPKLLTVVSARELGATVSRARAPDAKRAERVVRRSRRRIVLSR
jgi:hypothetical protein